MLLAYLIISVFLLLWTGVNLVGVTWYTTILRSSTILAGILGLSIILKILGF